MPPVHIVPGDNMLYKLPDWWLSDKPYMNRDWVDNSIIPDNSIDMIITSPPYWSQRNYSEYNLELGKESDFMEYIDRLVAGFNSYKNKINDSGALWVNIGDVYNGSGGAGTTKEGRAKHTQFGKLENPGSQSNPTRVPGYPRKTLLGLPFRFATGMIDSGWLLRNTIIWKKPSCKPSSARDRFTTDFEYFFFFTKNPKYYFKQQREPAKSKWWIEREYKGEAKKDYRGAKAEDPSSIKRRMIEKGSDGTRNMRAVWEINPASFSGGHFAVYPEGLIAHPIDACCPLGGIVFDPFLGRGTTIKEANNQDKIGLGFELCVDYNNLIDGYLGIDI